MNKTRFRFLEDLTREELISAVLSAFEYAAEDGFMEEFEEYFLMQDITLEDF